MQFDGLQMTLIVVFLLSAVAVVVVCDFLRETLHRRQALSSHWRQPRETARASYTGHAIPPEIHLSPGPVWVPAPSPDLTESAKRSALPAIAEVVSPAPELESRTVVAVVPIEAPVASPAPLPEVAIDAFLWTNTAPVPARPGLPEGMIDEGTLQEAIQRSTSFTGTAVSIGINDADGSMWHSTGLVRSVANHIAGLLGEHEFACRTAYDEFLIVCPEGQGAGLPSRLQQISERLWDYQLNGSRARSILFNWGGVQIQNQPLADAITSATDRMRQTKRVSNSIYVVSANALRKAV
jgi:hypothetical protein